MGKLGTFVARVASLAKQIGEDIKTLREGKIPYTNANKAIDFNTQEFSHNGNFIKRENELEVDYLTNGIERSNYFRRLQNVASLSRTLDTVTEGDIVITLPILNFTRWIMDVDIIYVNIYTKLKIDGYSVNNTFYGVSLVSGGDDIDSVKLGRMGDNTVVIIKRNVNTLSYGRVNIPNLYMAIDYSEKHMDKKNYKIEFKKEENLVDFKVQRTIHKKDFIRDPHYLDFSNFTNVPNFAQASNVFTKAEATNTFIPRAGDVDINGTKRFLQAPIVPNATLDSHAVNRGQVNGMFSKYIPLKADVGMVVETLLAFEQPIIVPEAKDDSHAMNRGQVKEMQGLYRDSKGNIVTKHILDNPDKYNISGERNVILALNTVHNSPVNVSSKDSFLHGLDHSMLGDRSVAFGVGHIVAGHHSAAFGFGNSVEGSESAAFGFGNSVEGEYSFAANCGNKTSFPYEAAFGYYNQDYNNLSVVNNVIPDDLRFSVGIGIKQGDSIIKRNAISIFKNGEIWFNELTPLMIERSNTNRVAVTKEYLNTRIPKPPAFGNHVLKSVGGYVQWVAE